MDVLLGMLRRNASKFAHSNFVVDSDTSRARTVAPLDLLVLAILVICQNSLPMIAHCTLFPVFPASPGIPELSVYLLDVTTLGGAFYLLLCP